MSGRLWTAGIVPLSRRAFLQPTRRLTHHASLRGSGLLRADTGKRPGRLTRWPLGTSSIHNVPAVRHASFARSIPRLFVKLARIPAMVGGTAVAGMAYIQYQANREYSQGLVSHELD